MNGTVHAQIGSLERLVMPGEVSAPHADTEATCTACHVRFSREQQRDLCLDCHEEIAADLTERAGFHGSTADAAGSACSACHTEHEGRDADILGLDRERFDHSVTRFALVGKHVALTCEDCHSENQPSFHAAETECYGCHADDDRHRSNLGTACADCHAETGWRDVRFDHDAVTGYGLTGKHAELTCTGCHADEHYEETPNTCVGCHAADDAHRGNNGPQCQDCHTTGNWQESSFDHFVRTGFALAGGHAGLTCESCHEGNRLERQTPTECYACHRDADAHNGLNGVQCHDCHRVTDWLDVTFDHARDAEFPLRGAHATLSCASCHVQPVETALPATQCIGCHADDDAHAGQLGESCTSCHAETAWTEQVRFDHDLTRFPLLGRHEQAVCEACHSSPAFHDAAEQCVDCHAEDDVHERTLGSDCGLCHNPNDWLLWTFDHGRQTDFELTGAHDNLDCRSCHRQPAAAGVVRPPSSCGSCHRSDDVHDGEFGDDCAECHTTASFRDLGVLR
jgi:hypothetical protein